MDNPASHRGEVIYAADHHVDCNHEERVPPIEERIPPIEECTPPSTGRRALGTLTNLPRTLLLCVLLLRGTLYATRCPKGHQLHH